MYSGEDQTGRSLTSDREESDLVRGRRTSRHGRQHRPRTVLTAFELLQALQCDVHVPVLQRLHQRLVLKGPLGVCWVGSMQDLEKAVRGVRRW